MIKIQLQLFGGRGASSGRHTYASGNFTEGEYREWAEGREQQFQDWLDNKKSDSLTLDGFIFEKYTKKEIVDIFKETTEGGFIPEDFAFSITYKDGKQTSLTEGDNTKGVKLTNIDSMIYYNDNTTGVWGNPSNFELTDLTGYSNYKKGDSPTWEIY